LRVEVNDYGIYSGYFGGNGKVDCRGCLARAALLAQYR
jgi:hypothetical protein